MTKYARNRYRAIDKMQKPDNESIEKEKHRKDINQRIASIGYEERNKFSNQTILGIQRI